MQMWIFLMLILSITTGTVLTLEQRSDKVDHKWDLTHRVPWTTPCPPWHYTAPQLHTPTNMLVLIIFSCMKRKKPHAKYVIWMVFFPPKLNRSQISDKLSTQNETKSRAWSYKTAAPADSTRKIRCSSGGPPTHLHIWAKSHLHVHRQKQGPHWCSRQWHLPLFGYVDALSLRTKAMKKKKALARSFWNFAARWEREMKGNLKMEVSLPYVIVWWEGKWKLTARFLTWGEH